MSIAALDELPREHMIMELQPTADSDFHWEANPPEQLVELGRMLFFDKALSGNNNIACATCHHPRFGTSDGLALGLGEGGDGIGTARIAIEEAHGGIHERVPRNSPALFNLGAKEYTVMFFDGRVEVDTFGYYESGFITPAKWKFPNGLENVLAAQAMFPITSPTEMAGQRQENPMAEAKALNNLAGPAGLWEQLGEKLGGIPEYVQLFKEAFPNEVQDSSDVSAVLAANAIAAFEAKAFRSDNSPFDEYLRTGHGLKDAALRGLRLFYGKGQCGSCHSGTFQTDHEFHAIAMPQIGPGKAHGRDASYWRETGMNAFVEDFGRGRVTYQAADNYKFRTPSLRNVELTAPYGHSGAYETLEEVVRHHVEPVKCLDEYQMPDSLLPELDAIYETTAENAKLNHNRMSDERREAFLRRDNWVMTNNTLKKNIAEANELDPLNLSDSEISDIVAFLKSLTDPSALNLEYLIPANVPSGLPVDL